MTNNPTLLAPSATPARDWRFYLANSWAWQGGPQWYRGIPQLELFMAQSRATGFPRLAGIALVLLGDAIYKYGSGPLLRRGMRDPNLGTDAKPWSLTDIAWRSSGVLNDARWELLKHANKLARYNG